MFDPEKPPELQVTRWINAQEPITLAGLRDKVVVALAFQMLCPGCVEHALPQAKRLRERFNPEQVAIIGLHCVFEHHHVMTGEALEVFMNEYRWPFPVGIDQPNGKGSPRTMTAYEMRGTPTLLIFDRAGRLRRHYFGRPDDIMLAAEIMAMATEDKGAPREQSALIERKMSAILLAPSHDHHGHHHHDHDCGHEHGGHDHHHHHQHRHDEANHGRGGAAPGNGDGDDGGPTQRHAASAEVTAPPKSAKAP